MNGKPIPIVVVRRDRTRMTIHNILEFNKHTPNNRKTYIVCSDRSYQNHCRAIHSELEKYGINDVVMTQTNDARHGLGAAMNNGLSIAFQSSDNAFVIENDYCLRKDLDLGFYGTVLSRSNIGHISFKHVNSVCNVRLFGLSFQDRRFIVKLPNRNGRTSFSVELGCQFISRRLIEKLGLFGENCSTGDVEDQYVERYNAMSDKELLDNRILACVDKNLFHDRLNSKDCVFYHIGDSTHGGIWNPYPPEYKHLNDRDLDIKLCERYPT